MAKYSGSGWHFQSTRHSNARKYGKAGGTYAVFKKDKYGLNAEKVGDFNEKARLVFSPRKFNIIPITRNSKYRTDVSDLKGMTAYQVENEDGLIFWTLIDPNSIKENDDDLCERIIKTKKMSGELFNSMSPTDREFILKEYKEMKRKKHFGQPEREYGFDLTGFKSAEDFEALLKANGLTKHKKVRHYYGNEEHYDVFSWSNSDGTLELRTGNNPITGEYNQPKMRKNEKGYASYMGIKGDNDKVEKLAKDIKRRATEIKDEDPKHNGFIW